MPVDDPGSRLFHLNLLFSVLMILGWLVWKRRNFRRLMRLGEKLFFSRSYWWNESTKVDYKIYILNSFFKIFLFIPFLDFTYRISIWSLKMLAYTVGPLAQGHTPSWVALVGFSFFAFVLDDGFRFLHHWSMHKIPWLWRLHQVHHSARILTPVTLYRIHPLESALATLRNSLSLGLSAGVFLYFFDADFSLVTLAGVNFFGLTFNFLGSNLRHSHVPISFGPLERVFISPKQHQIHHSTQAHHFDRNFGVSLSIWDQWAGTFLKSGSAGKLRFGLKEVEPGAFFKPLAQPFRLKN